MNRLEQLLPSLDFANEFEAESAGKGLIASAGDRQAPCSLFMPLHYERNYAYPLLVWLHGPRDSEQQLKRLMPLVSMRNYVAVAPRGVVEHKPHDGRATVYSWPDDERSLDEVEQRAFDGIASACGKANIARRRIFVAGFASGGTAALRLALRNPGRFAGVLSLCGQFPLGGSPLARLEEVRRTPLFLAAGQTAAQYAPEIVCQDLRLLHSAGMNVSLRVYPCGDEISPHMLTDMDRWMMELVTGAVPCVESHSR